MFFELYINIYIFFFFFNFFFIEVLVLPLGVTRQYVCTSPPGSGYGILWLVNGASATISQLPEYILLGEDVQTEDGRVQGIITLTADIRANNTHLRCVISHFDGGSNISVDVNLTLQG